MSPVKLWAILSPDGDVLFTYSTVAGATKASEHLPADRKAMYRVMEGRL